MEAGTPNNTAHWGSSTLTGLSALTVEKRLTYRPSKLKIIGNYQEFVRDNYFNENRFLSKSY